MNKAPIVVLSGAGPKGLALVFILLLYIFFPVYGSMDPKEFNYFITMHPRTLIPELILCSTEKFYTHIFTLTFFEKYNDDCS